MWYLSVNFISNNYHPLCMNEPVWTPEKRAQFQVMEQGAAILRKLDPDRPWFYQSGGAFSPIINSNTYFCWWPQAERRAWAQEWSRIGSKPLHVIETAFPYIRSFEGMSPGLFDVDKIRFYFEDCARYFGNAAYDSSEQDLLHAAQISRYGQEVGHFDERARRSRLLMKLKAYLISDTIPAWRISGVSGICPFAEYEFSFDRRGGQRASERTTGDRSPSHRMAAPTVSAMWMQAVVMRRCRRFSLCSTVLLPGRRI